MAHVVPKYGFRQHPIPEISLDPSATWRGIDSPMWIQPNSLWSTKRLFAKNGQSVCFNVFNTMIYDEYEIVGLAQVFALITLHTSGETSLFYHTRINNDGDRSRLFWRRRLVSIAQYQSCTAFVFTLMGLSGENDSTVSQNPNTLPNLGAPLHIMRNTPCPVYQRNNATT